MSTRSTSAEPPAPLHRAFRYGLLLFLLVLPAWNMQWYFTGDPYGNLVVNLMLLFNHLAFMFKWPPRLG